MEEVHTQIFKALSDPTRRKIFERLTLVKEETVHAITDHAGISQPAVSKHLKVLKGAGLVRDRPDGRQTYFRVDPKGLSPLFNWAEHYGAFWLSRFNKLENLLERIDE
jgi:DNA-binding transcriptional ArsR family regulator